MSPRALAVLRMSKAYTPAELRFLTAYAERYDMAAILAEAHDPFSRETTEVAALVGVMRRVRAQRSAPVGVPDGGAGGGARG